MAGEGAEVERGEGVHEGEGEGEGEGKQGNPSPENRTHVISNLVSRNTNSAENLLTRESYSNFEL